MNNGDLKAILEVAEVNPKLLPHLMMIYKLGKLRGIAQQMEVNKEYFGINYGSEVANGN